jgi:uncharacterized membrane protein
MDATGAARRPSRRRLIGAGILLRIGLGGLFDGIVLHQILQWHHMVSSTTPPDTVEDLELNTLGDGIVHAAAWVVTVAGIFVLMASNGARHDTGGARTLAGSLFAGWGLFNVVEGVIDHHLLGLHHVRPGADQLLYDVAFLIWGGAMLIVGSWLVARATSATSAETQRPDRRLDVERPR